MTMAVIESPGMPKTSAGTLAPHNEALFGALASTIPSTWPLPNFSGGFENRFETAEALRPPKDRKPGKRDDQTRYQIAHLP